MIAREGSANATTFRLYRQLIATMKQRIALTVATLALLGAASAIAAGAGPPPAPEGVTATPGADGAIISFGAASGATGASGSTSASGQTGPAASSHPGASYMVTVTPGNKQVFGAASPITVGGLQPASAYSFTVTASNAAGTGLPSARTPPMTTLAPAAGATPPDMSALKASLISFFAAPSGGPMTKAHGTGTDLTYTDSEAATVTVDVIRVSPGYEHAGSCLTHAAPARKRCSSYELLGSFTKPDASGANSLHFSGRLDGHALPGGVYQLRLSATANGLTGNTLKVPIDVF